MFWGAADCASNPLLPWKHTQWVFTPQDLPILPLYPAFSCPLSTSCLSKPSVITAHSGATLSERLRHGTVSTRPHFIGVNRLTFFFLNKQCFFEHSYCIIKNWPLSLVPKRDGLNRGISQVTGMSLLPLVAPWTAPEFMLTRWLMVAHKIVSGWRMAMLEKSTMWSPGSLVLRLNSPGDRERLEVEFNHLASNSINHAYVLGLQ